MAHLIRTLALGGWVLVGTWVAPPLGTTALEVAREQLKTEDAGPAVRLHPELPKREVSRPSEEPSKRPVAPPPARLPVDASAGTRI